MTAGQRRFLEALARDSQTPRAVAEIIRATMSKEVGDGTASSLIGQFQAARSPHPALRIKQPKTAT